MLTSHRSALYSFCHVCHFQWPKLAFYARKPTKRWNIWPKSVITQKVIKYCCLICRCISEELHALFRVLWSGRWAIVSPHKMLDAVWGIIPFFKGYAQQDAQEFLWWETTFDCFINEVKRLIHRQNVKLSAKMKICNSCHKFEKVQGVLWEIYSRLNLTLPLAIHHFHAVIWYFPTGMPLNFTFGHDN